MPELPEVETVRRDLIRDKILGNTICSAEIFWPRTLATPSIAQFKKEIIGLQIKALSRRGKYLVVKLERSGGTKPAFSERGSWSVIRGTVFLIIHLRMSGRIEIRKNESAKKHDRAKLILRDGREIVFHDTRKFGRWWLVKDLKQVVGRLGPEPFAKMLTLENFEGRLRKTKRMLKPLLLDQTFIAGLGNIYVDEALWLAKLHPKKNSGKLKKSEIKSLYEGILKAIQTGIKNQGTSLGKAETNFYSVAGRRGRNQDALNVFRQTGEPCPRCRARIVRIVVGQRSTHFCPTCQPDAKRS